MVNHFDEQKNKRKPLTLYAFVSLLNKYVAAGLQRSTALGADRG
jgi:hypothetical protein